MSVTVKYQHGITDGVLLKDLGYFGTVLALRSTPKGNQYEVLYKSDAHIYQHWFQENDVDPVIKCAEEAAESEQS